jgi:hypothetical protein
MLHSFVWVLVMKLLLYLQMQTRGSINDEEVKALCATLRKLGATTAGPVPAGGGVNHQIPNSGFYASTREEMDLTTACYMAKHYRSIARTLTAVDITVDRVQRYAKIKEA